MSPDLRTRATSKTGLAALLLAALLACGGGGETGVRSGGLELSARTHPAAPRVGANELELALRDAEGRPVPGARVDVEVRMPAMGAMPAMGGPVPVEPAGPGRYRARFDLDMAGTWRIAIRAQAPSGVALTAEGTLTIGTPGARLEVAGTPPAPENAPGPAGTPAPGGEAAPPPGAFRFDPARLRQVGVRSEPVRRAEMTATVRAMGRVVVDETTLHDVTVRVGGFVGRVEADALGEPVTKGRVLFELYGPDLYAAQQEYLEALRSQAAARGTSAPERADALARAAAGRLRLWGIDPDDVAALARRGTPLEYLPVRAPVSGYVIEKAIVAGSPVAMGQRVYRIAPLDRVWIDAEVYEAEVGLVAPGERAEVTLPYLPGQRYEARVAYVYPRLEGDRRTARVRLEIPNPELALRPAMYADVFLHRSLGVRLSVPESAVLRAGDRDFVFLDLGEGRLRPQRVVVGRSADGRLEILSGLEEGQPVVVAGTFLVASESRLRAALESW
jgi:Cu(I)/Ag(I) efflux system membrane fusion protein